jgi:MOSC domain-containing protein YiiM
MAGHQDASDAPRNIVQGRLASIQISNGGVPKRRVEGSIEIEFSGLKGDQQRDLRFHGGPDRAVCLFSAEIIRSLRDQGHPIDHGTTGENLTLSGVDWSFLRSGLKLRVGDVLLEITKAANPCRNIASSFADGDFSRISVKLHPGKGRMYARVLVPGTIRNGDLVTAVSEP